MGSVDLHDSDGTLVDQTDASGAELHPLAQHTLRAYVAAPVADANYTALPTDRYIFYTSITAIRTVTLPDAASVPADTPITVSDASGQVSATNNIRVFRGVAGQTIDGFTNVNITAPYGYLTVLSNGVDKFHVVGGRGPIEADPLIVHALNGGWFDQNVTLSFAAGGTTLVNGVNTSIGTLSAFMRLVGPTAAFSIASLNIGADGALGPDDGRCVVLYNTTSQPMTILNESTSEATPARRITTTTGGNIVTRGLSIVELYYEAATSRYIVVRVWDGEPRGLRERFDPPHLSVVGETLLRSAAPIINTNVLTSGTLYLVEVALPKDQIVNAIHFTSGSTAMATPSNWWFGLFDNAFNQLALTADQTTTAWAANTRKAPLLTSAFTTTYEGVYYLGILVNAGTVPSLFALQSSAVITGNDGFFVSPNRLEGNSTAGLTTPASCPATVAAPNGTGNVAYALVT